jgi:DNA ligase (NAD+)
MADFNTEKGCIDWLRANGFDVDTPVEVSSAEEVIKLRNELPALKKKMGLDMDGLVIKPNKINYQDWLNNDRPKTQVAFKPELEVAITKLISVEWSASGKNRTPVAIVEDCDLNGTTVSRANLCNTDLIKKLGIKVCSLVEIHKAGEIIPQITKVISTPDYAFDVPVPTVCEFCGEPLTDNGTSLTCNNSNCPETLKHRIDKWIDKQGIMYLARKTLDKIPGVNKIEDLYGLTMDSVKGVEGFGDGFQRVLKEIDKTREVTLAKFVAGFDLEGIGERVIQPVIDYYNCETLEDLFKLTVTHLVKVDGIADITAKAIVANLKEFKNQMVSLNKIVKIKGEKKMEVKNGNLNGMSFCFTGKLSMKRAEAQALVTENGGINKDGVTAGLTYLVTDTPDSGSSKNVKAQKLGTQVIDEAAFMRLING